MTLCLLEHCKSYSHKMYSLKNSLLNSKIGIPKISNFKKVKESKDEYKSQSLHEAHLQKIRSHLASKEVRMENPSSDTKSIYYKNYKSKRHRLDYSSEKNNKNMVNLKMKQKDPEHSPMIYLQTERKIRTRNNIFSLDNSALKNVNNTPKLNMKSKLIIVKTLSKDKNSTTEQKHTTPDSSYDTKKSSITNAKKESITLSMNSFPTITNKNSSIAKTISNDIKSRFKAMIDLRCKSARLSGSICDDSLKLFQQSKINDKLLIDSDKPSHHTSESFQLTSANKPVIERNNKEKSTFIGQSDSLLNHTYINQVQGNKVNNHTIHLECNSIDIKKKFLSTNLPITYTKESLCLIKKKKKKNIIKLMNKLIDKQILDRIDSNSKALKFDQISQITKDIENQIDFLPTPLSSMKDFKSLKSISSFQTTVGSFKTRYLAEMNIKVDSREISLISGQKIISNQVINRKLFHITVSHSIAKSLNEKYYTEVYHKLLKEFLIKKKKDIKDQIALKENEYFTNNLKKLDINFKIIKHGIHFSNHSPILNRSMEKKRINRTTFNKINSLRRKILLVAGNNNSITRSNSKYVKKMSIFNLEKIEHQTKNDSLLKTCFYSRGKFDATKLREVTNLMELRPRCKVKNIKFRLVDEQEEMKKNKNMSKESLAFRTLEIKLRLKDQLETIEEILFFLIKESNFKEFKKLLEQFHISLESRDHEGNTFLLYAVECSLVECVNYLIEKGAEINAVNYTKNTPLHIALLYQNYDIADLLLKHGADESLINKDNLTPWQCLVLG